MFASRADRPRGAILDFLILDFTEIKNILDDERIADPAYGSQVGVTALDPVVYAPLHYYRLGQRIGLATPNTYSR